MGCSRAQGIESAFHKHLRRGECRKSHAHPNRWLQYHAQGAVQDGNVYAGVREILGRTLICTAVPRKA